MADKTNPREVKLADGRTVTFDLNALTWAEVRELSYPPKFEGEDAKSQYEEWYASYIAKATGLSTEEVLALGFVDFRRLDDRFASLVRDPLGNDPN